MGDLIAGSMSVVLFVLSLAYVAGCARLNGGTRRGDVQ
jgi:hypothetical protein